MPASRKTFGYSLQMSAHRIVQSDFLILLCKTVIAIRPRIPKRCFKVYRKHRSGEATVAHLSEDGILLRGSVVEKTATNHFVYYFAILLWENL